MCKNVFRRLLSAIMVLILILGPVVSAWADMSAPTVTHGTVNFSQPNANTLIGQLVGNRAVLQYLNGMNISQDQLYRLLGAGAIVHDVRGTGVNIQGIFKSDPSAIIISPAGITVGASGQLIAPNVILSTGSMSKQALNNFMATGVLDIDKPAKNSAIYIAGKIDAKELVALDSGVIHISKEALLQSAQAALGATSLDYASVSNGRSFAAGLIDQAGVVKTQQFAAMADQVRYSGSVDASSSEVGQKGGSITTYANRIEATDASFNANGQAGGGDVTFHANDALSLDKGTRISADATAKGNGGSIQVIAGNFASSEASVSARGGPDGGNGGDFELSSVQPPKLLGSVDLGAGKGGRPGLLILDPKDWRLQDTDVQGINSSLNRGENMLIKTSSAGSGAGDVFVQASISKNAGSGAATLQIEAARNITVNQEISSSSGRLNVTLKANGSNWSNGQGYVYVSAPIKTNGGDLVVTGADLKGDYQNIDVGGGRLIVNGVDKTALCKHTVVTTPTPAPTPVVSTPAPVTQPVAPSTPAAVTQPVAPSTPAAVTQPVVPSTPAPATNSQAPASSTVQPPLPTSPQPASANTTSPWTGKSSSELFQAIKAGQLAPSTDPTSEWRKIGNGSATQAMTDAYTMWTSYQKYGNADANTLLAAIRSKDLVPSKDNLAWTALYKNEAATPAQVAAFQLWDQEVKAVAKADPMHASASTPTPIVGIDQNGAPVINGKTPLDWAKTATDIVADKTKPLVDEMKTSKSQAAKDSIAGGLEGLIKGLADTARLLEKDLPVEGSPANNAAGKIAGMAADALDRLGGLVDEWSSGLGARPNSAVGAMAAMAGEYAPTNLEGDVVKGGKALAKFAEKEAAKSADELALVAGRNLKKIPDLPGGDLGKNAFSKVRKEVATINQKAARADVDAILKNELGINNPNLRAEVTEQVKSGLKPLSTVDTAALNSQGIKNPHIRLAETGDPAINFENTVRRDDFVRIPTTGNGPDLLVLRKDVEFAGSVLSGGAIRDRYGLDFTPKELQPVTVNEGAFLRGSLPSSHGFINNSRTGSSMVFEVWGTSSSLPAVSPKSAGSILKLN